MHRRSGEGPNRLILNGADQRVDLFVRAPAQIPKGRQQHVLVDAVVLTSAHGYVQYGTIAAVVPIITFIHRTFTDVTYPIGSWFNVAFTPN